MIKKIINSCLDALFPPRCLGCQAHTDRREAGALCKNCVKNIPIYTALFCPECRGRRPTNKKTCHPRADFLIAAASSYGNRAVRELIHAWKYNHFTAASKEVDKIIEASVNEVVGFFADPAYTIIPIPLHARKERGRGFNQSREIARGLLESLLQRGVSAEISETLERVRNTKKQTEMKNSVGRAENLREAFAAKNSPIDRKKTVIIVDDVFTSGATMKEAARVLRLAGAKKIIGFVLALA